MMRCVGKSAQAALLAVAVLWLTACSTLQPVDLPDETTAPASTAASWAELSAARPGDWFVLLNDGPAALDWRLHAIDSAVESIDLQTFLWTFDTAGAMVVDRLLAAADRGVIVKLLVDDSLFAGEDPAMLALHQHRNIEMRIYNPFKRRVDSAALRWALNLAEFGRLDHRMHNKAMIIDNRVAIVGGRNLADEYFGLHDAANFRDMELLAGGPVVQRISAAFDAYWNDHWSVPLDRLDERSIAREDVLQQLRREAALHQRLHADLSPEQRQRRWLAAVARALPGNAELLVDRPPDGNPDNPEEAPSQVADAIVRIFNDARDEIVIVSAYLIPTPRLEAAVADAGRRGVRVRILTNSLSSNNHLAAHSAYRNHVDALLRHGAELYEVRTDAGDRSIYMLSPVEAKALALHAKTLLVDDDKVFIGSANLDPRSLRLNTEIGLLVESRELNAALRNALAPDFSPRNSWLLSFDEAGQLVWVAEGLQLNEQPATSFMQRIEDWFLSRLPIEGEM